MTAAVLQTGLPVGNVLPAVRQALEHSSNLVLMAPPGAGKTSCVPPALLDAPWLAGKRLLLVLPRRLAVRAAAHRIAELLGETVGKRVGYRTRFDSCVGREVRIECVTDGILVNRLLREPDLAGVGGLIFDEVHERRLDMDLGLALALDLQILRPELRILAMSATMEGERFSALLEAPLLEAEGFSHPTEIRHVGRSAKPLAEQMACTIREAMLEEEGSLLAFLPGVAEIGQVARALVLPDGVTLHILHGKIPPHAQQLAIRRGGRKCVLATAIAETSLTIEGVRLVVDSGLSRRPSFERATGLTRLLTERLSQATAKQRAGRAGREAPGIVWCLWEAREAGGFPLFDPPEILGADLAPLLLRLASCGVLAPQSLQWLDAPPAPALAAAREVLETLGAMRADGRLTAHGEKMAKLGLAPRLAHMLLVGARHQVADLAAVVALLIEEPGLGGPAVALAGRLQHFGRLGGRAAKNLVERWARQARLLVSKETLQEPCSAAFLLASAFPHMVARHRGAPGAREVAYLLASGRGACLAAEEPLAGKEWLAVGDTGGGGTNTRIRLASPLGDSERQALAGQYGKEVEQLFRDPQSGRYALERRSFLGRIEMARQRLPADPETLQRALLAEVLDLGMEKLPWPEPEEHLMARVAFARQHGFPALPDLSPAGLARQVDLWLLPRLQGVERLADVALAGCLSGLFSYAAQQMLQKAAPEYFLTPAGSRQRIDYKELENPAVDTRVQALFGLEAHPYVAGVPLLLRLLSPAGQPVALTRDLPGFWRHGWREVQRAMKGRYPRHPWPDDPLHAPPTLRSKKADARY